MLAELMAVVKERDRRALAEAEPVKLLDVAETGALVHFVFFSVYSVSKIICGVRNQKT